MATTASVERICNELTGVATLEELNKYLYFLTLGEYSSEAFDPIVTKIYDVCEMLEIDSDNFDNHWIAFSEVTLEFLNNLRPETIDVNFLISYVDELSIKGGYNEEGSSNLVSATMAALRRCVDMDLYVYILEILVHHRLW